MHASKKLLQAIVRQSTSASCRTQGVQLREDGLSGEENSSHFSPGAIRGGGRTVIWTWHRRLTVNYQTTTENSEKRKILVKIVKVTF